MYTLPKSREHLGRSSVKKGFWVDLGKSAKPMAAQAEKLVQQASEALKQCSQV